MQPIQQGDEQPLYRYASGNVEFDEARGELRVDGQPMEQQLGAACGSEATLARHDRAGGLRAYEFGTEGEWLAAFRRGTRIHRMRHESLGHRDGFVRVIAQRLQRSLQIADAIIAAHGIGVLHEDIEPANVLMQSRDNGCMQEPGITVPGPLTPRAAATDGAPARPPGSVGELCAMSALLSPSLARWIQCGA